MTEWLNTWIEDGIGQIYADNGMTMPQVTGDPTNQPSIDSWLRNMPCGCTVFFKGYCLHTSNRCETHCRDPFGQCCWHPHGKKLNIHIKNVGMSVAILRDWGEEL